MIKLLKIRPLFSTIVTTAEKYTADECEEEGIMIKSAGSLKEFQTVIAVGDLVRNIKPGDLVCLDPKNYAVHKYKENSIKGDLMENTVERYNLDVIELDGKPAIIWQDRDVKFVVEEKDVVKPESSPVILTAKPSIITNDTIKFS